MANEITVSFALRVANGYFEGGANPGQIQITQAGVGRGGHCQSIGFAAAEIVDFGDVATEGVLYLRNLDDTNYVLFGPDDGSSGMQTLGKLKPGEMAFFRVAPTTVMYAQADTGACILDVRLFED